MIDEDLVQMSPGFYTVYLYAFFHSCDVNLNPLSMTFRYQVDMSEINNRLKSYRTH